MTAMGDPEEVRAALAKVHKPWLGWLWQASRVALWVAVCITARRRPAPPAPKTWGRTPAAPPGGYPARRHTPGDPDRRPR